MKKRYINELLWHISLFGCIFVFNRNHLPWCQLELVDIICQKVVCTQTKISVFIIRPVSNMSQIYKYQTVQEILTLGKRNNMNKRYINELLYISVFVCIWCSCGTVALMVLGQSSDICGLWSANIRKLAKDNKGYGSAAISGGTTRSQTMI